MDDKFIRDYTMGRPGTIGGELKRNEEINQQIAAQSYASFAPTAKSSDGKADPRDARAAATPRAPPKPYVFKPLDIVIAVVVFLVTWLTLSRSMGGGTAAAFGAFGGIVAARFWRVALALLVVVVLLAVFLHHR
ncbi:MAG TPA: hypothetical protein VGM25_05660 [Caulobacteraceae bacterium]|jgi:hypothetical protein